MRRALYGAAASISMPLSRTMVYKDFPGHKVTAAIDLMIMTHDGSKTVRRPTHDALATAINHQPDISVSDLVNIIDEVDQRN